jgi:NAD(P)-dependent dehydrogenase (short-subunit alcohol dehydrogenase family)
MTTGRPLAGKVAVVAGATRGAGRGIARMLGEAGAIVYCAGRSTRATPSPGRPETIEETAEMAAAAGGEGVPARVDFLDPAQARALFERVRRERGRLDLLVNDVWGGDDAVEWGKPFWELDLAKGLPMLANALHTHIIASRYAAPLLIATRAAADAPGAGLIIEITDGDGFGYRGNYLYDLAKSAVIRMAYGQAYELRRKGVAAVAVTPGFLRSEAMLERLGVTEENWRDGAAKDPHFLASESPGFVGRAVAALAADPKAMGKSGRVFGSWTLSDEYGFTDLDGSRPHWGRHWEQAFGRPLRVMDEAFYAYGADAPVAAVDPDWPA